MNILKVYGSYKSACEGFRDLCKQLSDYEFQFEGYTCPLEIVSRESGNTIRFGYPEFDKYCGMSFNKIVVDEAYDIELGEYQYLNARVRSL